MSSVGYAMLNEQAVNSLVWFNHPLQLLTWTHPLLECLLLAGSVLAFCHAFRHYRQTGDKWLLQAWLMIIVHAILWEITVFNFEEHLATFWHGEFSLMLYHNRLPFYIVFGYYPALFYHALVTVQRLHIAPARYPRLKQALLTGLVFEIFYVACESLSPVTQWWQWNNGHIASQPVWFNIPANAYLWGLSYGFAYALLSQYFFRDLPARKSYGFFAQAGLLVLAAALIPLVAMVFMIPVNILVYGFSQAGAAGALIALYFLLAFWLLLSVKKQYAAQPDWLIALFPAAWLTFLTVLHLYLLDRLLSSGQGASFTRYSSASGSLLFSALGIVGTLWLIYRTQRQRR